MFLLIISYIKEQFVHLSVKVPLHLVDQRKSAVAISSTMMNHFP